MTKRIGNRAARTLPWAILFVAAAAFVPSSAAAKDLSPSSAYVLDNYLLPRLRRSLALLDASASCNLGVPHPARVTDYLRLRHMTELYLGTGGAEPAMVFHWHGGRAGLGSRGGGGPAVGLADLAYAGVTHVGVPQVNLGQFKSRNYISEMQGLGLKIVRTVERRWNAGVQNKDLGAIIVGWRSPQRPGRLLQDFVDNLVGPCDGIGWNLEHPIMREELYPVSPADLYLAWRWGYDTAEVRARGDAYVELRCRQFALIFQMYFELARRKFPATCKVAIAYSSYEGLSANHTSIQRAYGCDWSVQATPQTWRGLTLRPVTHAMCAFHADEQLPQVALQPEHTLPILHNIQLAPSLANEAGYRAQIRDRLRRLRPGDGIGMVEFGERAIWDARDRWICRMMAKERWSTAR